MPTRPDQRLAIVPAYNEVATVASVVTEIREYAPSFSVLVVDDGSTDGTGQAARSAGARVLRHPYNLGIGGAMQSGFVYAAEHDYELAVQIDADGQHDPREIPRLVAGLERQPDLDMIVGSRFLDEGQEGHRSSRSRRRGIALFSRMLSLIVRQPVTDPTSGLRLSRRTAIRLFAQDYPHDYPEVEAILMMHAHRLSSGEIAVSMRPRAGGRSSITTTSSAYYMVKVSLAILVGLFRRRVVVQPGDASPVTAAHGI